jgi:hypothetical protein
MPQFNLPLTMTAAIKWRGRGGVRFALPSTAHRTQPMAMVVKFPFRSNETQQERPREVQDPAALSAEVIVFPRMSLVDLRSISEAMRADRERQDVV